MLRAASRALRAAAGAGALRQPTRTAQWTGHAESFICRNFSSSGEGASRWKQSRGYEHFEGRGGFAAGFDANPRLWLYRAGLAGGACTAFYFAYRQEIPYSHRRHVVFWSPETSKSLGEITYRQVLNEAKQNNAVLPDNHPASRAIRRIGSRLAQTAAKGTGGGFYSHMKDCEWEFTVIKSPQVNAFVVPGGKVVVYTGLLQTLKAEDELAFVLAHEISHVVARHTDEKMTTSGLLAIVKDFPLMEPLRSGWNCRTPETEADLIGLQIMAESCYNPRYAPGVHTKIEAGSPKTNTPTFLSTHPAGADRVATLKKNVDAAIELYTQSDCEIKRRAMPVI